MTRAVVELLALTGKVDWCPGSRQVRPARDPAPVTCPECGQAFPWEQTAGGTSYAIIPDHTPQKGTP